MKTDMQLQQDVMTELKWEPSTNATDILVEVQQGVVSLSGHVTNYAEKVAAEHATQRVAGVRAMTINIDVTLAGGDARADIDIARTAEETLRWVTYMPKDSVKVIVENGWITLSGKLDWDYQRRNAVESVRHLCGVKGVSDLLAIKAKSQQSTEIRLDIEAALERHYDADGQDISVTVRGPDVTLSGTVTSWWQLDSACTAAWNSPGVQHVANQLIIAA